MRRPLVPRRQPGIVVQLRDGGEPPELPGRPRSPTQLMRAAGVEPPSPAVATILDAAYAMPPTAEQRKLWPQLSTMRWPSRAVAQLVACIGRRGLKSTGLVSWTAVHECVAGGHEQHAMPGGRIYFVVIAPELRQARETTRGIEAVLRAVAPLGVSYRRRDPAGCVELIVSGPGPCAVEKVIAIFTADAVSVRGYAVAFLALDEGGFLPSEPHLTVRDCDILSAVVPGMTQFPDAKVLWASTPGPSQGEFYKAVSEPPPDTLLVRCPTWVANPRITEQQCRRLARSDRHFRQEYEAGCFGALEETFLDEDSVRACIDPEGTAQGPRPGSFCIGLDVGLVKDGTALAVASCHFVEVAGSSPIVHVVLEHLQQWKGSRAKPLALPSVADRVAGVARSYGGALVRHDSHEGSETDRLLRERGVKSEVVSMAPAAQTDRWVLLSNLIHGRRLHIPADEELVRQLVGLRVTQLSSGAMRVQGAGSRADDLADAVALAVEKAVALPPTGGAVQFEVEAVGWNSGTRELLGGGRRWFRVLPNGARDYCIEPPVGTREWQQHVDNCRAKGLLTPAVQRWLAEQGELAMPQGEVVTAEQRELAAFVKQVAQRARKAGSDGTENV